MIVIMAIIMGCFGLAILGGIAYMPDTKIAKKLSPAAPLITILTGALLICSLWSVEITQKHNYTHQIKPMVDPGFFPPMEEKK